MSHRFVLTSLAIAALLWATVVAQAATAQLADPALRQNLDARLTATWQGQSLREVLARLSDAQKITVWLDRRVDPTTSVDYAAADARLGDALSEMATKVGLAAVPFHAVAYFGPKQTAQELATLSSLARQSLADAPADRRAGLLKDERWSIPRLSEPRPLLGELVAPFGIELVGDDAIPHDLWPERSLPPMTAVDRAILLLAGFDLTCRFEAGGRRLRVLPIERPVREQREYSAAVLRTPAVRRALAAMPTPSVELRGNRGLVSARWEEHEQLRAAIRGGAAQAPPITKQRPAPSLDARRFTLRIQNKPVGVVVDQIGQQMELNIRWPAADDRGAGNVRSALVSCDVQNATLDELLEAVLKPAELTFTREGRSVVVHRQPE